MTISKTENSCHAAQPDPELPDNCVEWNREGQSGHWSTIHGRTWLCSGPMSWAPSKDELRSLERFSRYGWDTSRVMLEYSNQLFELIGVESDLTESALAVLERDGPIDFDHEHSHRECRRQTKRSTVDTLCVLPLTWSQHCAFDRLGRCGLSVSQVDRGFTGVLYYFLTNNRHVLSEALFKLECDKFEACDADQPVWH